MDSFGEYEFCVRSYECGADGFAKLASICDYLQESASLHAQALGFAKDDFAAAGANVTWVLTKLRLQLSRYPRWGERVKVVTYPRLGGRLVAKRDFDLSVNGERLGRATSEWMVIDLDLRKLAPVPPRVAELANDVRPPVFDEAPFSRLSWTCAEASAALRFRARRDDIDLNGHVNNVRYVVWLCEALPKAACAVSDLELVFKSETLVDAEVLAETVEVEPGVYVGRIAAADGSHHVLARLRAG